VAGCFKKVVLGFLSHDSISFDGEDPPDYDVVYGLKYVEVHSFVHIYRVIQEERSIF
jgi:hypothetical protein